jgi:hypothetical protein
MSVVVFVTAMDLYSVQVQEEDPDQSETQIHSHGPEFTAAGTGPDREVYAMFVHERTRLLVSSKVQILLRAPL